MWLDSWVDFSQRQLVTGYVYWTSSTVGDTGILIADSDSGMKIRFMTYRVVLFWSGTDGVFFLLGLCCLCGFFPHRELFCC